MSTIDNSSKMLLILSSLMLIGTLMLGTAMIHLASYKTVNTYQNIIIQQTVSDEELEQVEEAVRNALEALEFVEQNKTEI